ncbi:MAG: hypothetical protein AAGD09_27920 [Cyanobacteria bacterium P01_F01_bin.56]
MPSSTSLSAGDRWVAGLLAAGVTFVTGYTVARVSLMSTGQDTSVAAQQNVIPHEGELWSGFSERF